MQVRTTAFATVYRSNFANHDVKYGALISEFKKAQELDKQILKPLLTNPSLTNNSYCHIACALKGKKNTLVNELDEHQYGPDNLNLSKEKEALIIKHMDNVSFT